MLFYATPVLYPIEHAEDPLFEHLLMINPLAVIFEQVRVWVLAEPEAPTAAGRPRGGGCTCCRRSPSTSASACFGVWLFNREAPRIAEDL